MTRFVGLMVAGLVAALAFGPVAGQEMREPARGSAERRALLDAIRPIAEWRFGKPVEFVVSEMRVAGDQAFAMLEPQRPGGGAIEIARTPMVARGDFEFDIYEGMDGLRFDVLYQRSGDQWVAVLYQMGATDAWFSAPHICAEFRPVIADFCQ